MMAKYSFFRSLSALVSAVLLFFSPAFGIGSSNVKADEEAQVPAAESAEFRCADANRNCILLQMIARGDFSVFDPGDVLHLRIYSAVLPMVKAVTEEDIRHYCEEFDKDRDTVSAQYSLALQSCLYSDILYRQTSGQTVTDAERVLLLFLEQTNDENGDVTEQAEQARQQIRENITEETLNRISDETGLSDVFVRQLIFGENRET